MLRSGSPTLAVTFHALAMWFGGRHGYLCFDMWRSRLPAVVRVSWILVFDVVAIKVASSGPGVMDTCVLTLWR